MKKRFLTVGLLVCALCLLQAAAGSGIFAAPIPQRIVSLGPINTENVYLLGAQDRLVANTNYCVRPEGARDKIKIGSVMQVSIEKIVSLRPDLVLATGLTQQKQLQQLQKLGLHVVQFTQPHSFVEICEQFMRLGKLLGVEQRAAEVIDQVRGRVAAIQRQYGSLAPQKVFLQIGSQPLFSSVKGSFTNDYMVYSNGINIMGEQRNGGTNYERVLAADPDVIIIAIMGSEKGVAAAERKKWMKFVGARAIKNRRVHVVDPDLVCSPSPATFVEALEQIARLIHPHP